MTVLERKTLTQKKKGGSSLVMLNTSIVFPGNSLKCEVSDKCFPVGDKAFHLAGEFKSIFHP